MDEDRARDFWERTLGEIEDGGFFAPVSTAEPPVAAPPPVPEPPKRGRRPTNVQLVLTVVFISFLLVFAVFNWLVPALF